MFRVIYLQIGAAVLVAVLAGIFVGIEGGVSAALGGGACILPNFLFAVRMSLLAHRADRGSSSESGASAVSASSYSVNFFVGEFIKIAATIALLVAAVKGYPELHWPSFLAGLVLTLQAAFIAFWKKT